MHTGGEMNFQESLNGILPRLKEESFLNNRGLGNEIPFYIFDYPAKEELNVRKHISFLISQLEQPSHPIKVLHIKLFELMVEHLREQGLLEKSFDLEEKKGSSALLSALSAMVHPERFKLLIQEKYQKAEFQMIFISGVGSIWPWVRTHTLLNNLQSVTGSTPVVMFYPGVYDKQAVKLFDLLEPNNYYRAFRLL